MIGWKFKNYESDGDDVDPFEKLLKIFKDLLVHTSGDVREALSWLTELDKHYNLTDKNYGIADFIEDLIAKGLIANNKGNDGKLGFNPTTKMEIALRRQALDDIFDQLKKSKTLKRKQENQNARKKKKMKQKRQISRKIKYSSTTKKMT